MRIWSVDTIISALALAQASGESTVQCDSPSHANRFRMAVYNHIRRQRLNIPDLQLSVSGADVIFHYPIRERAELKEPIAESITESL